MILIVLIFVLKGIISGNIKKTLLALGSFAAIFTIAYIMAKNDVSPDWNTEVPVTKVVSKRVGTVINMFYIIALLAVGITVFGGLKKLISK